MEITLSPEAIALVQRRGDSLRAVKTSTCLNRYVDMLTPSGAIRAAPAGAYVVTSARLAGLFRL